MSRFVLIVREEAQTEADEIATWYDEQGDELGDRFVAALEQCYAELRQAPLFQVRKGPYRYASISGFPDYRVVFAVDGATITVYQVRHTSRKPHPRFGP